VVAGGDNVDANFEEFAGDGGGYAIPAGRILTISDNEVDFMTGAKDGDECADGAASGFTYDVADEEEFHVCESEERVSVVQLSVKRF
jgi:hypothetical protein